ncbi:MAG: tetratricopeptide repeat protein, partial [Phycisphaerae bacterium]
MLHIVVFILPLAAGGCQTTGAQTLTGGLAEGKRAFEHNQHAQAVDLLTRFLAQQRAGPDGAHAYYIRGMARAKLGERPGAYDDLRRAIAAGPSDDVFWRTHMVLGTMHYEDSAWDRAGDSFIAALSRMPNNPPRDLAFYRLGQCYERLGQWKAARQPFQQL